MPHIIPIRDLKDTAKVSELCHKTGEPIFITKNGYGDMVLMSMKTYEEQLLMLDVFTKIAEAEEDIKEALAGNICICGTYPRHAQAILEAVEKMKEGAVTNGC